MVVDVTKYPGIGIVTPSLNQGRFIRETIDSILQQRYPHLDYWVIDGGSTDDTVEILASYGSRVKWISEKDSGQAHALNKGLKRITADIVAFINSDDVYLPGALLAVARYFESHPDAMWLTGDHFVVDGTGRKVQSYVVKYKRFLRRHPGFGRLAVANYIVQPSTFWRRELLDKMGFFDESLRYCFDYDFWMRIIRTHPLHVLPTPLSLFRIHEASKGGSQYGRQFAEEHQVLRRYTRSTVLLSLHRLHAMLIVMAYRIVKG
jgi:glycosyltransferase involved in cell wall biosynthesis